jgi:O-antigen/teichoic acid export membrane protein
VNNTAARRTVFRNIAANVGGAAMAMLAVLVAVPIYLRLLGPEAYGLVGLFTTVTVAALALDLGLGATLNREAARMRARGETGAFGDVVATLESGAWVLGVLFGAAFAEAAPTITRHWLTFATLTPGDVTRALYLMALAVPALTARTLYLAGLNGLERQGRANVLTAAATAGRALVTVTALLVWRPSVTTFFVAQVLALYVEVGAFRLTLLAALPVAARGGRIRPAAARPTLGFSAGVAGTMLLALGLTSVDQVILSAILPLAQFGYYTLAVAAANTLGQIVQPVTTAVYPRLSQLVEQGDTARIAEDYHFFSQVVAIIVLPAGCLLAFFPGDVLTLWTRSPDVARHAAAVLAVRAVGTMLNALMHVPHVMQLAVGWSSLGAWVNALALAVVVPATIGLGLAWGGVGAAFVWVALNLAMLLFAMGRMHTRVLPGELARWYGHVLAPGAAVVLVFVVSRAAMPDTPLPVVRFAWLLATVVVAAAAAVATATTVRRRAVAAASIRPA